jgi:NAD(P)-dependent dehydrogenase (short-subunit alcohol dehydrogenase family)
VNDLVRYDGRVFLITGGGRGLGRAQALLTASRGARVVVADNGSAMDGQSGEAGPAESVVREIVEAGGTAVACSHDISTEGGAQSAIEACLSAFGRIDGLSHNASTSPDLTDVRDISSADFEKVMAVNAFAGLWMASAAWPHMAAQNYGRVLFATSAGIYGSLGNAPYAAAKASYIGALRCLAIDGLSHGIAVNGIAPSASTRMTERFQASAYADWFHAKMSPSMVAVAAAYLLSEECPVTGEIFSLGGGRIARVVLAENEGAAGCGDTIEELRDLLPRAMADERFFYPRDLSERSRIVAGLLGFDGGLDANGKFAVKPQQSR